MFYVKFTLHSSLRSVVFFCVCLFLSLIHRSLFNVMAKALSRHVKEHFCVFDGEKLCVANMNFPSLLYIFFSFLNDGAFSLSHLVPAFSR